MKLFEYKCKLVKNLQLLSINKMGQTVNFFAYYDQFKSVDV